MICDSYKVQTNSKYTNILDFIIYIHLIKNMTSIHYSDSDNFPDNKYCDYMTDSKMINKMKQKSFYGTNIVNKPLINNIFFNIKNGSYEVNSMWCVLIITIFLLLSLLIKNANDEEETMNVINGTLMK